MVSLELARAVCTRPNAEWASLGRDRGRKRWTGGVHTGIGICVIAQLLDRWSILLAISYMDAGIESKLSLLLGCEKFHLH